MYVENQKIKHDITVIYLFYLDGNNNDSRRFGLGSDERKPYGQSYNGGHSEEYSVPNHMVGLLIGKGGENLKKIERMSGVSKVQFSNGKIYFYVYVYRIDI